MYMKSPYISNIVYNKVKVKFVLNRKSPRRATLQIIGKAGWALLPCPCNRFNITRSDFYRFDPIKKALPAIKHKLKSIKLASKPKPTFLC